MSRNHLIDSLRGFAITCVILLHLQIHIPITQLHLPHMLHAMLFYSGYYGVIIFFVISGFLITHSCIQRWESLQQINCRQFYRLRFARIMPCLLLLLCLLSILHLLRIDGFVIHTTSLFHAIAAALTFHLNWLEASTGYLPANWDILWSLSIEEAFYVFFPLLCLLSKHEKNLKIILCVFIMLGPFARTVFSHNEMWQDHGYLSCFDGIAMGCLTALWLKQISLSKKQLQLILLVGLVLFGLVFVCRSFIYHIGLTTIGLQVSLLELAIACLLIVCQSSTKSYALLRPIAWLGKHSYEVYLSHLFIIIWLKYLLQTFSPPLPIMIACYGLNFILWRMLRQVHCKILQHAIKQISASIYSTKILKRWRIQIFSNKDE